MQTISRLIIGVLVFCFLAGVVVSNAPRIIRQQVEEKVKRDKALLENQNRKLNNKLEKLQSNLAQLKADLEKSTSLATERDSIMKIYFSTIEALKIEIGQLQENNELQDKEIQDYQSQVNALEIVNQSQNTELEITKFQNERLEDAVAEVNEENEDLKPLADEIAQAERKNLILQLVIALLVVLAGVALLILRNYYLNKLDGNSTYRYLDPNFSKKDEAA